MFAFLNETCIHMINASGSFVFFPGLVNKYKTLASVDYWVTTLPIVFRQRLKHSLHLRSPNQNPDIFGMWHVVVCSLLVQESRVGHLPESTEVVFAKIIAC